MRSFFVTMCLTLSVVTYAQQTASDNINDERTIVEKLVKRDGRWAHFSLLLDVPANSPGFEATCCWILGVEARTMKDFIEGQLGTCEKVEPYDAEKFLKRYPDANKADLILYKIKPWGYSVGNLRVYTIQHINKYKEKETSFELCIIYDKTKDKVLVVNDIFVPEMAEKIKADFGEDFISIHVSDFGIWCAYASDGKGFDFNDHSYSYMKYEKYLTEDFKQSIGFSELSQHFAEMEEKIYEIVHVRPKRVLDEKAMKEFFNKNFHWPNELKKKDYKGDFYVDYVVEKDGSISNVVINTLSSEMDSTLTVLPLEKEMEHVLNSMPRCTPARLYNIIVRSSEFILFSFTRKGSSGIDYIENGFSGIFERIRQKYERYYVARSKKSYRALFSNSIYGNTIPVLIHKY